MQHTCHNFNLVLFTIYDVNQDGYVDQSDLLTIMKLIIGADLPDQQILEIVEKTISDMDEDKDGKLNFEEFSKVKEKISLNYRD